MYKTQVSGAIELGREGFAGDQQADRSVHGGREKAVHLYPVQHYEKLSARFPEVAHSLVAGSLGENLSSADLDERNVRIGEVWALGTALLQICQPRSPCWKIDERFFSEGMAAYIAQNSLTGWYWRVIEEGRVGPGDSIELFQSAPDAPTLHEAMLLWKKHRPPLAELKLLAEVPGIARDWRNKINQRLTYLHANNGS